MVTHLNNFRHSDVTIVRDKTSSPWGNPRGARCHATCASHAMNVIHQARGKVKVDHMRYLAI